MFVRRSTFIALALVSGLGLAGCTEIDVPDFFGSKKPLPGERKAVFPQGVPGVTQGVPPEYRRGGQPDMQTAVEPEPAPAPPPKPKPVQRRVAAPRPIQPPPAAEAPAQAQQQQPAAAPWPAPQPSRPAQSAGSPWPSAGSNTTR